MTGQLCEECGREIRGEVLAVDGLEDVRDLGGVRVDAQEFDQEHLEATVRLSCSCDYLDVEAVSACSPFSLVPEAWATDE